MSENLAKSKANCCCSFLFKQELESFASIGWEGMDELDRNQRLKWLVFSIARTFLASFMMRIRIPNGILTSTQMRVLAEIVQHYCQGAGFQAQGNADISVSII
jgi:ferredoxin-nitrite reductase